MGLAILFEFLTIVALRIVPLVQPKAFFRGATVDGQNPALL